MAGERTDDGRPTVLVVDEPDTADRYSGWLAGHYDVRTSSEVGEAVESIRDDPDAIDAVLLNRRTSGLADDRVLVSIHDAGIDCPVALVTDGRPDVDEGVDDYLAEPVSKEALLRSVESLLTVEGQEALRRELSAKRVRRNVLRMEHGGRISGGTRRSHGWSGTSSGWSAGSRSTVGVSRLAGSRKTMLGR